MSSFFWRGKNTVGMMKVQYSSRLGLRTVVNGRGRPGMQNGWPVTLCGLVVVLFSCGLSRCLAIVARFALPVAKGGKVECCGPTCTPKCGSRLLWPWSVVRGLKLGRTD